VKEKPPTEKGKPTRKGGAQSHRPTAPRGQGGGTAEVGKPEILFGASVDGVGTPAGAAPGRQPGHGGGRRPAPGTQTTPKKE